MKQTVKSCGVVAAAGSDEMLQGILLVLRDVQESLPAAGPQLRVTKAQTITQVKQCLFPAGAVPPPDILLFAMSSTEYGCLDDILLLSGKNPGLRILLLVRQESYAQISYRCKRYPLHVFPLPLKRQVLAEILRLIVAMRGQLSTKEEELFRLRKKVNEIGIITKAKCILIETRHMTEEEAHHYLEREAMDRNISKKDAANEIIRKYS